MSAEPLEMQLENARKEIEMRKRRGQTCDDDLTKAQRILLLTITTEARGNWGNFLEGALRSNRDITWGSLNEAAEELACLMTDVAVYAYNRGAWRTDKGHDQALDSGRKMRIILRNLFDVKDEDQNEEN